MNGDIKKIMNLYNLPTEVHVLDQNFGGFTGCNM
jgi:hypothetical protein